MKERDYYPIIESFFKGRGYYTLVEWPAFPISKVIPDIIAVDPSFSKIITVEVKLNNFRGAFWQAWTDLAFSDYAYLAFPERYAHHVIKRYRRIIKGYGLGIIALKPWADVLVKPSLSRYLDRKIKHILLHRIREEMLAYASLS